MSRTSALIVLGILTLITPFSGLPMALRSLLTVACGASILGIGLMLRAREAKSAQPPKEAPTSEPTPPSEISPI